MSKEIRLSVIADTKKYQAAFAEIPGMTDKEAAKAALKLEKRLNKAQERAAKEAAKAAKESASSWGDAMSTAAGMLSADLIKGFVVAVAGIGQEIADLRNELGDLSAATGVSVEALSGLRLAAELSGNSLGPLEGAVRAFPKALADVAMGTGEAKIAFDQLGITAEDAGRMLGDTDAAFRQVVEQLQLVEGTGKRAELATRAFGESGLTLMQVLGDKRLEEFTYIAGRFGTDVGPQAVASAQAWQAQTTMLGLAMDGAKAQIFDATVNTSAFSNAVVGAIAHSVFFTKIATNLKDSFSVWDNPVERMQNVWEALRRARIQTLLYVQELTMTTETHLKASDTAESLAAGIKAVGDEAGKAAPQISKAEQATAELLKMGQDAFKKQLTAQEALLVGYSEQLAKVEELAEAGGDAGDAATTRAAIEINMAKDLADLKQKQEDERLAAIDAAQAKIDANRAKDKADSDEEHADRMAKLGEWRDASVMAAETISLVLTSHAELRQQQQAQELQQELDGLDALRAERGQAEADRLAQGDRFQDRQRQIHQMNKGAARDAAQLQLDLDKQTSEAAANHDAAKRQRQINDAKERIKTQRQDLREAAKLAKAAALLEVAISTSAAILRGFAMFGPPPSPVGIAAAAAATAAGVVQAGAIRREPLPKAHSGEFIQPDEQLRTVRAGEAILNQRAAADLGGAAGVRSLNSGAGAGPIVVQTVVDGRIVAEALGRQLARRQGTADSIIRQGSRPLGQLSPYGGS